MKVLALAFVAVAFSCLVIFAIFGERSNTARKCQHAPGSSCQCAGERDGYSYACECCAASPCRPDPHLDLDAVLKGERDRKKAQYENQNQ